ncbi:interferon lambda receptor 1 [Anolis sagrei]|uniref:interferon lambda receptor 1 n=1 Tax=Anolis sagrei TaxID=38937 RepID=UPI0035209732
MLPFGVFLEAVLLLSFQQVIVEGFLPPPRNVSLVSKDFSLFLTWLPDERYPPGVSYRVQWKNPFAMPWRDIPHCRDISESICNITCVSPELNNRYWVQVRAQMMDGTRNLSSNEKRIVVDYEVDVDIVPPILQLRRTKDILGVNVTFTYPSCAEKIFQQDLSYDLKFWAKHGTEKPREFKGLTKNAMDIDIMDWTSGNYCVHAKAFFSKTEKWSNFSEPICTLLPEKSTTLQGAQNWGFVAFPILILFSAGPISLFLWYKNIMKKIKTPQALDFSRFGSTKKLLELSGEELIPVHSVICAEVPLISGWRIRPNLLVAPSLDSMLEEDNEEEDEEDDESPILYTKRLKSQKKEGNGQNVAMVQKALGSSSGKSELSGDSHLSDGTDDDSPILYTKRLKCQKKEGNGQDVAIVQKALGSSSGKSELSGDSHLSDGTDDDSPILYTKRLKCQKKEGNGQDVAIVQKALGSSSGKSELSGDSHLSDGTDDDSPILYTKRLKCQKKEGNGQDVAIVQKALGSSSGKSELSGDSHLSDGTDDDSPILYTKRLKCQKKEGNGQDVAIVQKALGSSSGKSELSRESHLSNGTVSGNPQVTSGDNNTSGFSESKSNSLSENSSTDSSLGFPVAHLASTKEGQESGDIDLSFQWTLPMKEAGFQFLSGLQFGGIKDHLDGRADDAWVNLDEIQDNLDSFKIGFIKDSSSCDGLLVETPLLEAPCCENDLENGLQGGNGDVAVTLLSNPKFHSYRPKLISYISRT